MKRIITCCLLGVVSLASAAWAQAGKDGGTEKAITALEYKWLESQKTNKPEMVEPLLAEKFVETNSEAKVLTKAQAMEQAKGTKYTSADYEDVKVTVFGDAAIATGGFMAKGTDPSGKPFEMHERWTDTWVKMADGKWQCVATQGTALKM